MRGLLAVGLALVLCVLGVSCVQNPLLFGELDSRTRELALYRLDSVALTRFDAKLVARLPNVPAAGETACNGNTCFVLPRDSAQGVVYAIDLASGSVRYLSVPLAGRVVRTSVAATEQHFFVTSNGPGWHMASAVGVNDGSLVWTAFLQLPPLAISPIGREVMVVSDGGPTSRSQRLLVLELFNLLSDIPIWSVKFFTNRPEEIVAITLDPTGSTMFVVQQNFTDSHNTIQTVTTFNVPRPALPGLTYNLPGLEGSKLIAPVLLNGTQLLVFGQYPLDSMIKAFAYDINDIRNSTLKLKNACLLPWGDDNTTWSGASLRA